MSTSVAMVCREYIFHGRVQGVGFRWRTQAIAERAQIQGTVENQSDGTVRLVAQGEIAKIDALFAVIEAEMGALIGRVECTELPLDLALVGFKIRHSKR